MVVILAMERGCTATVPHIYGSGKDLHIIYETDFQAIDAFANGYDACAKVFEDENHSYLCYLIGQILIIICKIEYQMMRVTGHLGVSENGGYMPEHEHQQSSNRTRTSYCVFGP